MAYRLHFFITVLISPDKQKICPKSFPGQIIIIKISEKNTSVKLFSCLNSIESSCSYFYFTFITPFITRQCPGKVHTKG